MKCDLCHKTINKEKDRWIVMESPRQVDGMAHSRCFREKCVEEEREACAAIADERKAQIAASNVQNRLEPGSRLYEQSKEWMLEDEIIAARIRERSNSELIPLHAIQGRIWGISELPRSPGEIVNFKSDSETGDSEQQVHSKGD